MRLKTINVCGNHVTPVITNGRTDTNLSASQYCLLKNRYANPTWTYGPIRNEYTTLGIPSRLIRSCKNTTDPFLSNDFGTKYPEKKKNNCMKYDAFVVINKFKASRPQLSVRITGTPHIVTLRRDKRKSEKKLDK